MVDDGTEDFEDVVGHFTAVGSFLCDTGSLQIRLTFAEHGFDFRHIRREFGNDVHQAEDRHGAEEDFDGSGAVCRHSDEIGPVLIMNGAGKFQTFFQRSGIFPSAPEFYGAVLHDVGQQFAVKKIVAAAVQNLFAVDVADVIPVARFKVGMNNMERFVKSVAQEHQKGVEIAPGTFCGAVGIKMNLFSVGIVHRVVDHVDGDVGSYALHPVPDIFPYGFRRHEVRGRHMLPDVFQRRGDVNQMFFFTHSSFPYSGGNPSVYQ